MSASYRYLLPKRASVLSIPSSIMLIGHLGKSDQHAAGAVMRFFCLWGTITKSMSQSGSLELTAGEKMRGLNLVI